MMMEEENIGKVLEQSCVVPQGKGRVMGGGRIRASSSRGRGWGQGMVWKGEGQGNSLKTRMIWGNYMF